MFRSHSKAKILSGISIIVFGALIWVLKLREVTSSALPGPESYAIQNSALTDRSKVNGQLNANDRVNANVQPIFASQYPASTRLQDELRYAKFTKKLLEENELLINRVVSEMGKKYNMPPSVLWCLLFQESRLDHLRGISKQGGSRGLGQFSSFGFYEVNHQLDKFYPGSSKTWVELLGRDVRPVTPTANTSDPSSYFYIPTAVISSATYLNNRYHHLSRLLNRQKIPYDPQVLWLHAALAYNKGSRSVLSLWKETRRYRRKTASKIFSDRDVFMASVGSSDLMTRSLMRIWSQSKAEIYSKEASRHLQVIHECAIPSGGVP